MATPALLCGDFLCHMPSNAMPVEQPRASAQATAPSSYGWSGSEQGSPPLGQEHQSLSGIRAQSTSTDDQPVYDPVAPNSTRMSGTVHLAKGRAANAGSRCWGRDGRPAAGDHCVDLGNLVGLKASLGLAGHAQHILSNWCGSAHPAVGAKYMDGTCAG
jgi:hypothetical protein